MVQCEGQNAEVYVTNLSNTKYLSWIKFGFIRVNHSVLKLLYAKGCFSNKFSLRSMLLIVECSEFKPKTTLRRSFEEDRRRNVKNMKKISRNFFLYETCRFVRLSYYELTKGHYASWHCYPHYQLHTVVSLKLYVYLY